MKTLKLKSILFSLMAIAMLTVFLSSCEKDTLSLDTPINLEKAPFNKEVVVKNKDGIFTFDVSSNNKKIMSAFNENSISFTFLDETEIIKIEEKILGRNEAQESSIDLEKQELDERKSNFVGISLSKIDGVNHFEAIPPYKFSLDVDVLDAIRDTEAITIFDFKPDVQVNGSINDRMAYTLWQFNKQVSMYGDCGKAKTITKNYWAKWGSSEYDPLSTSEFKCFAWINPCCKLSNASSGANSTWIRRIEVWQDVLPYFYAMSNNCGGAWGNANICNNQQDQPSLCTSNSTYYPNGCPLY